MEDKKEEHLRNFRYYCNFKELNDDLKKLENIEDVVKKYWEVYRMFNKYELKEINMVNSYTSAKKLGEVDGKYFIMHQEYFEKVRQLEKIKNGLAKKDEVKKDIERKESWEPIPETNDQADSSKNEEIYHCDKCLEEKSGSYLHHKTKNDGYKFCSTECYKEYYGEYCSKCVNELQIFKKYLTVIQDGNNNCCRACYRIVEKEREQEEREEVRYCKYCSTKLEENNPFKFCKSDTCLKKFDEEVNDKEDNINDNIEREREREREKPIYCNTSLLRIFIQ